METKHTKGEWEIQPCTEGIEVFIKRTCIARCPKDFTDANFNKTVEANAKLISAAPELLEALIELKTKYLFNQTKAQAKNNNLDETLIKVENAIKKATE